MRFPKAIRQLMAVLVCAAIVTIVVVYVKNIPDSRMPDSPRVRQSSCMPDSVIQPTNIEEVSKKDSKSKKHNKKGCTKKQKKGIKNTKNTPPQQSRNYLDEEVPNKTQESNSEITEPTLN